MVTPYTKTPKSPYLQETEQAIKGIFQEHCENHFADQPETVATCPDRTQRFWDRCYTYPDPVNSVAECQARFSQRVEALDKQIEETTP